MTFIEEIHETNLTDALEKGNLLWDVNKIGLMTENGFSVPNNYAVVRDDIQDSSAIIGVVGSQYTPIANAEAFAFFDILAQDHGAIYKRAVAVNGGSKVILQAQLPQKVVVNGNDEIDLYLTLYNTFDGSSTMCVMVTPIRLFCTNKLISATKHAVNMVKISHTISAKTRMTDALNLLSVATHTFNEFGEAVTAMANKMVDRKMVNAFLDSVIGDPSDAKEGRGRTIIENQRGIVEELFVSGMGNNGKTMFDLYNGLTEFVDHQYGYDDTRFINSLMGKGSRIKIDAFRTAMAMI